MKDREQLEKEALRYIDASQMLKAAEKVLEERREALVPAFKKFLKPDEKGSRTLEFGDSKIALVPARKIDEEALKAAIGPEAARFTERIFTVSSHLIRVNEGAEKAQEVEEAVKAAIRKVLKREHLPAKVVQVHQGLDTEAALAFLPKDERLDVKEITTYSLRPYPEKKGFKAKKESAQNWLDGSKEPEVLQCVKGASGKNRCPNDCVTDSNYCSEHVPGKKK